MRENDRMASWMRVEKVCSARVRSPYSGPGSGAPWCCWSHGGCLGGVDDVGGPHREPH